jgi:hypothetical protein
MSAKTTSTPTKTPAKKTDRALIAYLRDHLPGYPFDAAVDDPFVEELVADFAGEIDLLEETKSFRWFYDNQPVSRLKSVRLSLRRWITNAKNRRRG